MKTTIYFIMFFILLGTVTATMYINDNRSLYRSYDDTNFNLILPYQTTNYSLSTNNNITSDIRNLETSSNGQYVIFIDGNHTDSLVDLSRRFLYSQDYGETWNCLGSCSTPYTNRYYDTAMSENGSVIAVVYPSGVWISNNYGVSWSNKSIASTSLNGVSISPDGNIISLTESIGGAGIFISTNSGYNFTKKNVLSSGFYRGSCITDNIIYAIGQSNAVSTYVSYDDGNTWEEKGAYTGIESNFYSIECFDSILLISNQYSLNNGSNFYNNNIPILFHSGINNFSQIYGVNDSRIFSSLDIANYTLHINEFTLLKGIAVSDIAYSSIPNQSMCLNENTYCSNAIYSYYTNSYTCISLSNIEYCNLGCDNSTIPIVCNNNLINDCNVLNSRKCYDSTSYALCSDSNSDGALDLKSITFCSAGEICVDGFQYAFCKPLNYTMITGNTGFDFQPYSVNNNLTSYAIDTGVRTLKVITQNVIHGQQFYDSGIGYISRDCKYTETTVYSNFYNSDVINNTVLSLSSAIGQNTNIKYQILPKDNIYTHISITSQLGTSMDDIIVLRNTTAKSVCIKYLNNSDILCDYDYSATDTLKMILFEYEYNFQSNTYDMKIQFDRDSDATYLILNRLYAGNDILNLNFNSTNMTLYNVSVKTHSVITNPSTATQNNSLSDNVCFYNTAGTYKIRSYFTLDGSPSMINYKDYLITISKLGATTSEVEQEADFNGLSTKTKYWLMLGISIFVLIAFIILVASLGDAIAGVIAGLVVSMITSLSLSIIFDLSLLIPILYIIIGGAIVAVLFRKITTGV